MDRRHNLVGSRLLEPDAQLLAAIQGQCAYRGWNLLAAHVRSNHVHTIVEAETRPEKVMNDRKRWARHGSTRWLWKDEDVRHALQYVIDEQGEPMAAFVAEDL